MRKLKTLFTVLFLAVLGLGNVWGAAVEYSFTIQGSDFNTTSYAANNGSHDFTAACTTDGTKTMTVACTSNQVMKNSDNMQWQKNNGYIYNTTDLKTIKSVTVNSSAGSFTTYYGTTEHPTSGTTVGNGFFTVKVGNATGTTSSVVVVFEISEDGGDPDPEEPTLESIAVSGTPDKTAYKVGDAFDPAGLVVTGTYSEGDLKAITEGITWNVSPETLTEGLTSVSVTATVSGVESEAYVVNGLTVTAPDPTVSFIFNTDAGLSALDIAKPASGNGTNLGDAAYTSGVITMTATDGGTKTRVWNSSGTTDLRIYNNGGTLTFTGATITKIELAGSAVNGFTANVGTYATNTWSGSATSVVLTATGTGKINTITVSYVAGSAAETVATPVLPAAGAFVGSKEITLSCETDGASIYYTLDGTDPTSASTLYNGAFTLSETATVKAIAVKDGMLNSSVASATYTKVVTLNSMDEIFAAATTAGSTAASKVITFDNWVISGVKGKNAYLTDNNGKGLIIFNKDANIDFEVGDILSGTATCNVQLYNGSAELTALTSATEGLTVTKGGSVTVKEIAVADLGGANTGAVIKLNNVSYTQDGTKYYFGDLQAYWNLMSAPASMTVGAKYDVTGVYVQYNAVKEILPRTEADIEEAASDVTLTSIAISGTVNKDAYFVGDAFDKAGLVVTATYSDASTLDVTSSAEWSFDPAALDNTSITIVNVTATFNEVSSDAYPVAITVSPAPLKVTWDLSKDETATATEDEMTWTSAYATMGVAKGTSTTKTNNYYPGTSGQSYTSTRMYKNSVLTVAPVEGYVIDKVEFAATSTGYAAVLNSTWTNASASVNDKLVTVTPTDGEAAMSITLGNTTGFTSVVVYYHVGATKYNVVENLSGCSANEENAKKFVDGTDELTLYYTLTDGYIWPENITVKVGETVLSTEEVDYLWEVADEIGTLEIAYEMHDNLTITIAATAKEVESIAVKTAPTKVEYYVGDNFDPAGLVITATYNDESTADIAYADAAADFTFAPALDAALALTDENVVITFNDKTCNQAISVTKAPLQADWVAKDQGFENKEAITGSAIKHEGTTVATVTFDVAEGTTPPAYYTTGTAARAYGGNTFTVAALKGFTINKIVLSFASGEDTNAITANVGEFDTDTWTGSATAVTFTIGGTSGHRRISTISVYYEGELATPTGIVLNTDAVKKEFAFGETFNSDNLVVKAVYSDESEEDVTLAAEVVAPNMENAGENTVTVNYLTFSETYNITVAEPIAATSIELSETSISVREDKTAKLTATVLPAEAVDKAVTWSSSNEDVVTVDQEGNVTPVAVGTATITVKMTNNAAVYAECTVEVTAAPEKTDYTLVTDASALNAGDVIILGCAEKGKVAGALGENAYLASIDATFADGVASATEAIEFTLGKDGDNWTLTSTEGKLGATAAKKMTTNTEANNYVGTWTIAITEAGVATITSTGSGYGAIKYNAGSPRFLNYASGQTDIEIYRKPVEYYTRDCSGWVGDFGTICLPYAVAEADHTGATFFKVVYAVEDAGIITGICLEEVGDLEAGKPYIFQANDATVSCKKGTATAETAGSENGLIGSYTEQIIGTGYYVIAPDNTFAPTKDNTRVGENRAYLDMKAVPAQTSAPAPVRRRIVMGTEGTNTATGMSAFSTQTTATKMIRNGQLIIVREGVEYNVNGQVVK